jgi:transcriptional regulator with PAS, ATPase and Fis domain
MPLNLCGNCGSYRAIDGLSMIAERLTNFKVQDLCTENEAMHRCLRLAALAAESDVPVLILGETGTGKTLLAQAIHNSSARFGNRFISFNASAMSDTLLESQLFGHERGAFTGAQKTVKGKFELADSGTLFLDEIADMSPLAQAKILRAVEYGEFERLGSERMLRANVRIISATNTSLLERIRQGRFREDLYHRLAGLILLIPPLRQRMEDLPGLIAAELDTQARTAGKKLTSIHPLAMERLLQYHWPGNLRELHYTIRTVVLFCNQEQVQPEHIAFQPDLSTVEADAHKGAENGGCRNALSAYLALPNGDDVSLNTALRRHIRAVYQQSGGNQRQAARLLGISRARLVRHLRRMQTK